ncbi:hypothetical protein EOD39_10321 [Acipenser ruthenus]|uniref:Uncharacterized protein n=1 Tax=Acipenser ruthenus TaxID=7906 RepID=A0A662YTR7_ACIRT|nr:hypothetical protein EOD39_10321 [Acipenser ruthenus]
MRVPPKELVDILQQQVKMLVEDSAQNNSVLGQDLENIFLDLEQLQGTESHLKNLVEKLQQENKVKTKHVNYLQAELERIPSVDASLLEELQAEVFKWKNLYEDLCSKVMPIMSHKHTMDSKKLPEGTLA